MIKACIFDLDGTLLDTLTSLWYTSRTMLLNEGLMPLPKDNYRYYVGNGSAEQLRRVLADTRIEDPEKAGHDPKNPEHFSYYLAEYYKQLEKTRDYEVRPFDGIPELLKELKARGIKLSVLSNKPDDAVKVLIPQYFGDTFDVVRGVREGEPRKPNPFAALKIAGEFGTDPSEIMYLGDTDTDMQTGKAAGMLTIGVLWGFRDRAELEENHADHVIAHPLEALFCL